MQFQIQHPLDAARTLTFAGEFRPAEKIALLGSSGAGKTTLMTYLAGLEIQRGSQVCVAGKVNPSPQCSDTVLVQQQPAMFGHHSVQRTLDFASRFNDRQPLPLARWSQQLGIADLLSKNCLALSVGQQQRVALLRALATGRRWLLLDESFSGLDQVNLLNACQVVSEYCRLTGSGLLLASHNDTPQRVLCNSAYCVAGGRGRYEPDLFKALQQQNPSHLQATVAVELVDEQEDFLLADCAGQPIYLFIPKHWVPGQARLTIAASEVSVALSESHQSSMVNRLSVTLVALQPQDSTQLLARLQLGQQQLWASISRRSVQRLQLTLGQRLFAEFKVGAVRWHGQLAEDQAPAKATTAQSEQSISNSGRKR